MRPRSQRSFSHAFRIDSRVVCTQFGTGCRLSDDATGSLLATLAPLALVSLFGYCVAVLALERAKIYRKGKKEASTKAWNPRGHSVIPAR